eukprot:CAMPEP_0172502076 /NCGR_PEP_ID=MMETSP1066-20121228/156378_1 /TAXON_ID=671091 /ORGANISM="Coscinodiscus wailesii, Strain CCMP2513" /LENGTH=131 /DNA_ID=CAMNT_0013277191 /DNA_START=70 /DNA_END=462 /DNA_ORIENTATION=-
MKLTMMHQQFAYLPLLLLTTLVSSFQPNSFIISRRCLPTNTVLNSNNPKNEYNDFADSDKPDKDNVDNVDWDAEWKKVVEGEIKPKQTSGIYKSDVELAAIKAKRVAETKIDDVRYNAAKAFNFRSLQGDW